MRTVSTIVAGKTTFSPAASFQTSAWHSPAPYLFIGLSVMLGLIAFALLNLACSCRKNSGETRDGAGDDLESGDGEKSTGDLLKVSPILEEKIVVIMAGDLNPSFLATSCLVGEKNGSKIEKKLEMESGELAEEKPKEESYSARLI